MKKIFIILCLISIALAGCGVKSDLEHDKDYPRNYPVY